LSGPGSPKRNNHEPWRIVGNAEVIAKILIDGIVAEAPYWPTNASKCRMSLEARFVVSAVVRLRSSPQKLTCWR
jgi:hypothetical protein